MMKRIITILLLMLPVSLYAQTSICGVDFGASYSTAERILENKFGYKHFLSDRTQIIFENKMYAGITWDRLMFLFQSDGTISYLNRAVLVRKSKTAAEAKENRDALKRQMEGKYFIMDFTDEKSGFKYYMGGSNPTNPSYPGFTIDIIKYSNGTYGTRLDYGPYDYVKEEL